MILLLLFLALITYLIYFYSKVRRLPPGPLPLPFIGNTLQLIFGVLVKKQTVTGVLRSWQVKYGDVHTFWFGRMPTVNICDLEKSQEAMVRKGAMFVNRPYMFLLWVIREGRGIIWSNDQHWTEQRRFALHTLRNMGLGRQIMEEKIIQEVDYRAQLLSRDIDKAGGHLILDPAHHIDVTVGNIINRMLFTERFTEENEKEFFDIRAKVDKMAEEVSTLDFFLDNWNRNIWPFEARHEKMRKGVRASLDFLEMQVKQRKEELESGKRSIGEDPECYVDAFFAQMQKEDNNNDVFNEEALIITLGDLWFAGQETTAATLYWAFSYLTLNPLVIFKAQEELDKITGRNKPLRLADKPNVSYLNAVIFETLRLSSIVFLNLLRETAEDTQVGDCRIEKGTAITAQLCLINTDPKHFPNPYEFNPERFLSNNLEQLSTPFGLGKRACPGESLARAELFLILGNLLLTYNFMADPKNPPSMKAAQEFGNIRRAAPFKMIISRRT